MKKAIRQLILIFLMLLSASVLFADNSDYATLRKFLSARMYGEAYNELLRQELSGNAMDPKLKNLKKDLLDRTKAKLEKQAKVSPDDAGVFTILADIAFQQGDYDRASQYASTAINNNGSAMANYIFAKILFRKGNVSQAFDQMSKVLEAMPDSPIIFNDFQFLYTCQQYGVNTAKKLTKDSSFLIRTTPIAYDGEDLDAPESPFDNDPTATADAPDFSDYNTASSKSSEDDYDYTTENETDVDEDLAELSKLTQSQKPKAKPVEDRPEPEKKQPEEKETKAKETPLPDETGNDDDLFGDEPDADDVFAAITGEKVDSPEQPEKKESAESEVDPEAAKIAEAERLLESAKTKFKDEYLDDAYMNIQEINKIYPALPGKEEVENKILYEKDLLKRYNDAFELLENNEFDKALKVFKEAYNYKPKKFAEAPYYLGRCYLLKDEPDKEQALKNFEIALANPDLNDEARRDILWTKIEILIENERYEDADEIYTGYFLAKEKDFAESQNDNTFIYYKLWWELCKTWILIGFSLFLGIIAFVFILQFLPDIAMWGGDPLVKAQKALDNGDFQKAVKFGEKGLAKPQPIQRDRQIREVLIQAYFALEDYEKVQMHAKTVLKGFPENAIAWGHLAKASIAVKDTSHEAVKMYEDMYHNDPSRRDLLPILAHYYASTKNTTPAAMEILTDYHNDAPGDQDTIIALAEGYIKNRTMTNEIVPVLGEAIRIKDKIEYRELLARTFSKCGMYNEAARECINVLNRSINNVGIHVVYTSSMKKLKKINEAIEQYNIFINNNPGNSQLLEIVNGLKKEAVDTSTLVDDVPKLSDELGMPGMDDDEIANFVEPPPEGFEEEQKPATPIPDFMQEESVYENKSKELPSLPDDIQTLDPFADNDPLLEGFDTEELPEELGGTARVPTSSSSSLDSLINDFNTNNGIDNNSIPSYESFDIEAASSKSAIPDAAPKTGVLELGKKLDRAKDLCITRRWDEVIDLLSPEFASERNLEAGLILVDAWLGNKKPDMALEIIQTLDIDPEMMNDKIKDAMYRTAEGLELAKKYKQALHMYDTICNADINYKDAFDRSDRLYSKIKSLG